MIPNDDGRKEGTVTTIRIVNRRNLSSRCHLAHEGWILSRAMKSLARRGLAHPLKNRGCPTLARAFCARVGFHACVPLGILSGIIGIHGCPTSRGFREPALFCRSPERTGAPSALAFSAMGWGKPRGQVEGWVLAAGSAPTPVAGSIADWKGSWLRSGSRICQTPQTWSTLRYGLTARFQSNLPAEAGHPACGLPKERRRNLSC